MVTKHELQQRSIGHLQGMCRKAGLDDSGSKAELIERLLDPKGRVLPPAPSMPTTEPTAPVKPSEEPSTEPEPES